MKVTLPWDPEWKPLEWAKENCPSYITNDENRERNGLIMVDGGWAKEYYIDYFFSDEKDATMFALRWL